MFSKKDPQSRQGPYGQFWKNLSSGQNSQNKRNGMNIGVFGMTDRGMKFLKENLLAGGRQQITAISGIVPNLVQQAEMYLDPLIQQLPRQARPRFYPDFRDFLTDRSFQMVNIFLPPGHDDQAASVLMHAGKAPVIIAADDDPRLRNRHFSSPRRPPERSRSTPTRTCVFFLLDQEIFQKAQTLFEAKKYDQALLQFTSIIKEYPDEFLANWYIARSHMMLANHSKAAEFFKTFVQNGQNQQAFQKYALHKGLSESDFNPYLFTANYNLALIELLHQSFTAGRTYLSQASRYNRDSAKLWLSFGISNYFLSEMSKAEKNFQYVLTHYAPSSEAIQASSLLNRLHRQLNADGGTIHLDANHTIIVQFED
jgi:tetratricopeptide (TPR) repeat protein